jgi:hypothetical protein
MKRFEIIEIANGWLICYNSDVGYIQRFFSNVDDIVEILKTIVPTENESLINGMVRSK